MTLPENQVQPEEQMVYIDRYKQMDEEAKAKEKEPTPTPEKKGFMENKRLIAIMSGIALLVVIGGYTANKIFNKNQPQTVATELPTTPVETPQVVIETTPVVEKPADTVVEIIPTVESLEIDGALIKKPEELAKMFNDERSTNWLNAGATRENAEAALATHDLLEYAKKVASKYDQTYIDALFIKNWELVPSLAEVANRMKDEHILVLYAYFSTSFPNMNQEDTEPYTRGIKITGIDSSNLSAGNNSISIITTQHDYDNAQKNRISTEPYKAFQITGQDNHPTLSFSIESGKIKLSGIVFN